MNSEPKNLSNSLEFNMMLGFFYSAWAVTDAALDFAIGKFMRLTHAETHILTAGMEYGRKAQLLRNILYGREHKNRDALIHNLNKIQNDSLRNVFAHSYIASDDKEVTFISRRRGGAYSATEHDFTAETFKKHVDAFIETTTAFYDLLEVDDVEFFVFQHAALSVNGK